MSRTRRGRGLLTSLKGKGGDTRRRRYVELRILSVWLFGGLVILETYSRVETLNLVPYRNVFV